MEVGAGGRCAGGGGGPPWAAETPEPHARHPGSVLSRQGRRPLPQEPLYPQLHAPRQVAPEVTRSQGLEGLVGAKKEATCRALVEGP